MFFIEDKIKDILVFWHMYNVNIIDPKHLNVYHCNKTTFTLHETITTDNETWRNCFIRLKHGFLFFSLLFLSGGVIEKWFLLIFCFTKASCDYL